MSRLILVSGIRDTDYILGGNLQSPQRIALNNVYPLSVADDVSFNGGTVFKSKNLQRLSKARLGEQKEAGNNRKLYKERLLHKKAADQYLLPNFCSSRQASASAVLSARTSRNFSSASFTLPIFARAIARERRQSVFFLLSRTAWP